MIKPSNNTHFTLTIIYVSKFFRFNSDYGFGWRPTRTYSKKKVISNLKIMIVWKIINFCIIIYIIGIENYIVWPWPRVELRILVILYVLCSYKKYMQIILCKPITPNSIGRFRDGIRIVNQNIQMNQQTKFVFKEY